MEPERDRIAREIDILGLQHEAAEAAGGKMTSWESEDAPLEVREQFWGNVAAYEKAGWTTHRAELLKAGVALPEPASLNDEQLTQVLWDLIHAMACRSIYLDSTNHLSDRELYEWLYGEGLTEPTKAFPPGSGWNCHIDLVGSGSEEHTLLYMRYFADEKSRAHWLESFPDYEMPPREEPPYDRDRLLPQAVYEVYESDVDGGEEWEDEEP